MLASRTLPDGYVLGGSVRVAGNRSLAIKLNLLAVPWVVICLVATLTFGGLLRTQGWTLSLAGTSTGWRLAIVVVGLIGTIVVTLVAHEAAHGLVLWLITRARPTFGFKGWYAYADAPGWFLSRGAMVTALLAPLVLLPLVGAPVVAFGSGGWSLLVICALWLNGVVALGDLYLLTVALRVRGPVIFGDAPGAKPGESGSWFVPIEPDRS